MGYDWYLDADKAKEGAYWIDRHVAEEEVLPLIVYGAGHQDEARNLVEQIPFNTFGRVARNAWLEGEEDSTAFTMLSFALNLRNVARGAQAVPLKNEMVRKGQQMLHERRRRVRNGLEPEVPKIPREP